MNQSSFQPNSFAITQDKTNKQNNALEEAIPRNKFTFDKFMKDKTLNNEHQKLFTKIDNLLEQEVVKFEMNPSKENTIFG